MPPSPKQKPTPGAWAAARNAWAQARGYPSYYAYRVRGYGRRPMSEPAPSGERLARARGHRSQADLLRQVAAGSIVYVGRSQRNARTGRLEWAELVVRDERGRERTYRLQGSVLKQKRLQQMVQQIRDAGGEVSPSPSLDLRRLDGERRAA